MTKTEFAAAIEKNLESLGKLIKDSDPLNLFDITGELRRSFEYLLAASLHMKNRHEDPPTPKLMRRSLF